MCAAAEEDARCKMLQWAFNALNDNCIPERQRFIAGCVTCCINISVGLLLINQTVKLGSCWFSGVLASLLVVVVDDRRKTSGELSGQFNKLQFLNDKSFCGQEWVRELVCDRYTFVEFLSSSSRRETQKEPEAERKIAANWFLVLIFLLRQSLERNNHRRNSERSRESGISVQRNLPIPRLQSISA